MVTKFIKKNTNTNFRLGLLNSYDNQIDEKHKTNSKLGFPDGYTDNIDEEHKYQWKICNSTELVQINLQRKKNRLPEDAFSAEMRSPLKSSW